MLKKKNVAEMIQQDRRRSSQLFQGLDLQRLKASHALQLGQVACKKISGDVKSPCFSNKFSIIKQKISKFSSNLT